MFHVKHNTGSFEVATSMVAQNKDFIKNMTFILCPLYTYPLSYTLLGTFLTTILIKELSTLERELLDIHKYTIIAPPFSSLRPWLSGITGPCQGSVGSSILPGRTKQTENETCVSFSAFCEPERCASFQDASTSEFGEEVLSRI